MFRLRKTALLIVLFSFLFGIKQGVARSNQHQQTIVQQENLEDLKAYAERYAQQNLPQHINGIIKVKMGHLDSRLRLNKCEGPLHAFLPVGKTIMNTNIIGVKCQHNSRWSIYVPVKIEIYKQVVVAAQPIARGEALTADKLSIVDYDVKRLRGGYFETKHAIIGHVAKRNIGMNRPITKRLMIKPRVVKRGDQLTIVAGSKYLQVSMPGTALMDGRQGQSIRVKNNQSKRVIEATIVKSGVVRVAL